MGENQEENAIVTSTGEYVVAWDFNKVKKGYLDKYHIKKCVLAPPLPWRLVCLRIFCTLTGMKIKWCKITSNSGMTRRLWVFGSAVQGHDGF